MKTSLLTLICAFYSLVYGQEIAIDSKAYHSLKTQGMLTNQSLVSPSPQQQEIHYTGHSEKTGICDCLVQLDSSFILAMAPNDDLYSNIIALPFSFSFYGVNYDSLYINNNGNISFSMPYSTFTAFPFPDPNFNMIAPFWADVDTRSTNGGNVWYKINPHSLVIIWDHVGYFSMMEDKLNTFQLIISDGQDTIIPSNNNVSFCYGDMQWTTGDASSGIGGFGGFPATVGVNIGNGVDYFQVGQFDTLGTAFDGPYNTNDQVDFLDNQEIYFDLASSNTNIPPLIMSGLICDTIDVYTGDTLHKSLNSVEFVLGASTPEINETLTSNIQCSLPSALTYVVTPVGSEFVQYDLVFNATNVQPGIYTIDIDVSDDGIPAQTTHKSIPVRVIYDGNLSGIQSIDPNQINLYPNPSNDFIHLSGTEIGDEIQLVDLQGNKVQSSVLQAKTIDVSILQKGLYLLSVYRNGAMIFTSKVQKD